MNRKKLAKIKKKLRELLRNPQGTRSSDLIRLATKLGRDRAVRGKEPTYVRNELPIFFPLSIPDHPGDMKVGTVKSIVDTLLDDSDQWEQYLDQHEDESEQPQDEAEQSDETDDKELSDELNTMKEMKHEGE